MAKDDQVQEFCYFDDQEIPVYRLRTLIAVIFSSPPDDEELNRFRRRFRGRGLRAVQRYEEMQEESLRFFRIPSGNNEEELKKLRADLVADQSVEMVGQAVWLNEPDQGFPSVLTDEFVVRFQANLTEAEIREINDRHGVEILKRNTYAGNSYLLQVTDKSDLDALQMAALYLTEVYAIWAHPNLVDYTPDRQDPLFGQQWHLQNTGQGGAIAGIDGQVVPAWGVTTGNPAITIAVIDNGFDMTHPDFAAPGKISPFAQDFQNRNAAGTPQPPTPANHGTSCAGVATALRNNPAGGSGMAPACTLLPIRNITIGTGNERADMFVWTAGFNPGAPPAGRPPYPPQPSPGADVISCSWGPDCAAWPLPPIIRDALDFITTYGRGGRGCVIFWAAGNGNENISTDQWSGYQKTIAVAACNDQGVRSNYSDFGAQVDICAPSNGSVASNCGGPLPGDGAQTTGIVTTARQNGGNLRDLPGNPLDYTNRFGGTSSAAPLAAGVGALMLSVRPNLTWVETRDFLRRTARQIDNVAHPGAPPANGDYVGGFSWFYGFGMVQAGNALTAAPRNIDGYIKDNAADSGALPSAELVGGLWTQPFWDSPSIWIRQVDDGIEDHQNALRGQINYVHARIHNRGAANSLPVYVRFYITHFAGTQFQYPADWLPEVDPSAPAPVPFRPGTYLIGEVLLNAVGSESTTPDGQIAKVAWPAAWIPPETVTIPGMGPVRWHPCILVEVSPQDGPGSLGPFVYQNNNLAQKNITIEDVSRGSSDRFAFVAGHRQSRSEYIELLIDRRRVPSHVKLSLTPLNPAILEILKQVEPEDSDGEEPCLVILEPTKVAIPCCGPGEEGQELVLHLPAQSSIALVKRRKRRERPRYVTALLEGARLARRAGREVIELTGREWARVRFPVRHGAQEVMVMEAEVPGQALAGDTVRLDVAEVDDRDRLTGGVAWKLNVT